MTQMFTTEDAESAGRGRGGLFITKGAEVAKAGFLSGVAFVAGVAAILGF